MAEPRVLKELEEELICSVCLDVYRNPVSLSCGHSFCEACIQGVLSNQRYPQGLLSCPLCSAQEALPTKLQPNIQLRSVVQKFLDTSEQNATLEEEVKREMECEEEGESSDLRDEEILCDFCLEKPQPAVKTCMNCETSLCEAHLGKHSTKAFLTSHVLMEPCDARVLAERRCSQHGKLLECYCVTDSICVCMLCCATSSHRSHEIISVEEAFGQAQDAFPKTVQTLKKHEAAVNKSLENLLSQQEKIKALERLHRNQLENSFNAICEQLDRSKTEVLGAISDIEKQQLSQIEPWIKEHNKMKDAASRNVQELEALRDQKDPVLFLKEEGTSP
ncbi:E3 ubiquitin/ISG15 ligase TRIM25-like isoform X2 [Phasianus colchicus]|uniref:E3 ubiquitin/ISG15 ligase TRIM25-like isoform X2 n=1 Tax=Phasianus colchicus TaxID=9054 RepID=UPI00129E592A|nr:E3 ubiquitin/ISG15 ligase TRIM25-like isoform X2 [Phasianus colchicus]